MWGAQTARDNWALLRSEYSKGSVYRWNEDCSWEEGIFQCFCFAIFFSPISSLLFYPAFLYTCHSPFHSHILSGLRLFRTKDETIHREKTRFQVEERIQRAKHGWSNSVLMWVRYDKREAAGKEEVRGGGGKLSWFDNKPQRGRRNQDTE